MYLKSLTMKGFKSFADRVSLNLEPGITAVVGPNGSGKSNILDAVLWVLGERNAKNLRGQSMEDVIFAGSSARKATSVAEVTLVLDNTDHTIPLEFDEISIARRMYRSGESEYLINGTIARRMDVLEILHDSGLGSGTHSIISQGALDSVLRSKPEDRRLLIEEAAGTLKHKQRMAKSQRKLEKMAQYVERVSDITAEVGRQLGPLERKAKRARTYAELSGQLSDIKLSLAVDTLRALQEQHALKQEAEADSERTVSGFKEHIEKLNENIRELEEKVRADSRGAGELSRLQQLTSAAIDKLASTSTIVADRRRSALDRSHEIEIEIEEQKARSERFVRERATNTVSLEEAQRARERIDVEVETYSKRASELNEKLKHDEGTIATLTDICTKLERSISHLREERQAMQETVANGLAHMKVLEGHAAELDIQLARLSADAKHAQTEAETLEDTLRSVDAQEKHARELVGTCLQARTRAQAASDDAASAEKAIAAQIEALEELERKEAALSGHAREAVEAYLTEQADTFSTLSHTIKTDDGYEGITETLLGQEINAILIQDSSTLLKVYREADLASADGPVTFVITDEGSSRTLSSHPAYDLGYGTKLIDHITCESASFPAVDARLWDVVVVDDIDEALSAHRADTFGYRFVTKDGCIVWPSGMVTIGQNVVDDAGVLKRLKRIEELKRTLTSAHDASVHAQADAEEAQEALRHAQEESLKLTESLATLKGSAQSARALADQSAEKLGSARRELERLQTLRAEAEQEVQTARPDSEKIAERIEAEQAELARTREELARISDEAAPLKEELPQCTESLSAAKLEAAKIAERLTYVRRVNDRYTEDIEQAERTVRDASELLRIKRASAERIIPILALLAQISEAAKAHLAQTEQAALNARQANSGVHKELSDLRDTLRGVQAKLDHAHEELSAIRVDKAKLGIQVETAVSVIVDECACPLDRALSLPALDDRMGAEDEAFRLTKRIANLGTINPDAAQEYDELKKRYDYFSEQLDDLRSAAKSLTRIDRIIEQRMKDDFVKTFDAVDHNFQEIFSMLFPGGRGYLALDDPEDIEHTGIEVNAQPAGKRIAKMSLMSGGEKSLTALALLFALYRTRATPFYILDEVEAALDDTNLRRLVSFINDMRASTQLILITHQRRTMETADVLFGVSMQADGVTKVVSQKL